MKIYLASSWRNPHQPSVLADLRAAGHDVYDFRNPAPDNDGFRWSEIDPDWQQWTPAQYRAALTHPIAERGFKFDMDALRACDACVLVLPCGRSAHLELGWAAGAEKLTYILQLEPQEPELMAKMCTAVVTNIGDLIWLLDDAELVKLKAAEDANEVQRCKGTFRAVGHTHRCELAAGHPGRHADGGLWWSDAGDDATARLAQLREESFDQGREQGLGEAHELIVQVAEGLTKAEGDDVDAEVVSRIVVALMRTAGALRDKSAG